MPAVDLRLSGTRTSAIAFAPGGDADRRAAHEHLARWFFGPDGKPDDAYKAGVSGDRLERMQAAWAKAVMLTLTLWTEPYTKDGLW